MIGFKSCRIRIFENLRALDGAPSVQMAQAPPSILTREEDEDAVDPDTRAPEHDNRRQPEAEFYTNENDQDQCEPSNTEKDSIQMDADRTSATSMEVD